MSARSQFGLLRERRFLPYFLTQFSGALNDNVFRNGVAFLLAYQLALPREQELLYANLALALFILPFFLFSALAGELADKYEKSSLIRAIKLAEIPIMGLAALGFLLASPGLLLVVMFLMGLQSTLFGPIKYSLLPQVLDERELTGGNGLVETGTSLAILLGLIAGGASMSIAGAGPLVTSLVVVALALFGYLASRFIPPLPATAPTLALTLDPWRATRECLRILRGKRAVLLSVLGISWFWMYGAVFTAQAPGWVKYALGGDESLTLFVLALFAVGIALGSLACERLSGRRVEIGLVPFGAAGMTLFALDVYRLKPSEIGPLGQPLAAFLAAPGSLWLTLDLLLIGVFAGFYIVPLYALIQQRSEPGERARVIAANNILNAAFIVAAAALAAGLTAAGLQVPEIFLVMAVLNLIVTGIIFRLVPEFLLRFLVWLIVSLLYRIRAEGLERVPERGAALIVCNHVSYVDALILMGMIRRPIRFVMDHRIFRIPILSFAFRTAGAIPIASAKEDPECLERAFSAVDRALEEGELVGIFPEGRLTPDGEIQPFRRGLERILARRPVPVVPAALTGLWESMWSRRDRLLGRMRLPRRFRARIGLRLGEPVQGSEASAASLEAAVRALRGERP